MVNKQNMRPERASQFAPFDALKGLSEELRKKEAPSLPRPGLSEERADELDSILRQCRQGDTLTVTWYHRGQLFTVTGELQKLDVHLRKLSINGTAVPFADLYDLERL